MHSSKQISRLLKAKQQASNSSIAKQERQKRQSVVQNHNLSSGIPSIDTPTLIGFLHSLGLNAVEADLLEPNSIRTREMCELLLMYFAPHRMEHLRAEKEKAALEFVESLEISMEHAETIAVYRELQFLLEKIAFKEFKLIDILSPRSHRLQRMLSVVYNYKLFRDSAAKQFLMLSQDAVDKTALYKAHVAEKEALQAKTQQLRAKREAERQEAQEWEAKNQEAESIVRQLRKEGDAILKDIDAYKSERHQLKDTLQEIQFVMINVIEYIRTLKQYESMDVNELSKNLADLAIVIQKNTEEVNHMELDYPKVEQDAKETKATNLLLAKDIQRVENLTKLKADAHRQQKTNEAVKQNIQSLSAEQNYFSKKLQACIKSLSNLNDRLHNLDIQKSKKDKVVDQHFKDLEEKKKVARKELELQEAEKKKHNLDVQQVKEESEMAAAEHQSFMRSVYLTVRPSLEHIDQVYKESQAMHL
ncbi:hypothetical protein MAM1_0088d04805 [Mucor ambiguus]|uniref:Kinetochore protein Nuf2 N-terminal domain-containing protein n=1 Tax=Mucor ambiguus TaxID=91626 RepID=A0A0C9LUN5_9FUNG|nr:hypothetical protein MAM1_0088d04805 [Mucor ambiguus]